MSFLCFKLLITISSPVEISSCWCCWPHFSRSPLLAWKSVAALIRTRSPLEPSFVVAVWVTCPWEQCWSHLLASRCHWVPALHRGLQVLSPAARYWRQPWATAAAFSKPFSSRATCPDPPVHTARSAPWPTQKVRISTLRCMFSPTKDLPPPQNISLFWIWEDCISRPTEMFSFILRLCTFMLWAVVMEKTFESPLDCKEIQPVHPKGNQSWIFIGRTDAEAETPILSPPDAKNWLIGKDPDAGKDWRREEKRTTEDEMIGWHHRLDEHEFEQALGVSDGQGNLACCSPSGHKESDMTEWLNWTERTHLPMQET